MSYEEHRAKAAEFKKRLNFAIITVSTSRFHSSEKRDESGEIAKKIVMSKDHKVVGRWLVPDDVVKIRRKVLQAMDDPKVDVIVISGGTGPSKTDVTIKAVSPLLDKELPGFGEAFRIEGYKEIGAPALLSSSMLGIANGKVIVCLPGSPDGVKLGLNLIIDELPHIAYLCSP